MAEFRVGLSTLGSSDTLQLPASPPAPPPPPPPPSTTLPFPHLTVQAAFPTTAFDPPVWTDLTADVEKLDVTRGRQHELARYEPGKLSVTFDARQARKYDPSNTAGPYFPNIDIAKRIQVLANWNLLSQLQAAAAPANVLTAVQSSFETGTTGWTAGGNTTIASVTTQALDGTHSLRMTAVAAGGAGVFTPNNVGNLVPISGPQTYQVIAYVRAATVAQTMGMVFAWYDANATFLGQTVATLTDTTTGWNPVTLQATVPSAATQCILAMSWTASSAGEVHYMDNVSIMPAPQLAAGPTPALVGDSSTFEGGTLGNWIAGANTTAVNTTAQAYVGTRSLAATAVAAGSLDVETTGSPVTPITAGRTYFANCWVKAAGPGQSCRLDLYWTDGVTAYPGVTGTPVTNSSNGWTELTVQATAPPLALYASLAFHVLNTNGVGEVHYLDQVGLWQTNLPGWVIGGRPSGWTAGANTTLGIDTSWFLSGNSSMTLTATSAATLTATTTTGTAGVKVYPGRSYTAMCWFRTLAVPRSCTVGVAFYDASGTSLGTTTSIPVIDNTPVQATVVATAPSNAAFAAVILTANGAANGEIHNVDQAGLFPAANLVNWSRGGPYYLFTGFTTQWRQDWLSPVEQQTVMDAYDGLRMLGKKRLVSTAYQTQVIADGASRYWKLSDAPLSTTVFDTARSVNGTVVGTIPYFNVPGPLLTSTDTALSFGPFVAAGNVPYVSVAGGGFNSTQFSVEFWVQNLQVAVATGTSSHLMGQWTGATNNVSWDIGLISTSNQASQIYFTTTNATGTGISPFGQQLLYIGQWYHVVCTFDGTNSRVYINGNLSQTTGPIPGGGNNQDPAQPTLIGTAVDGTRSYGGFSLAQVAFYNNTTLTAAQIATHYQLGVAFVQTDSGAQIAKALDTVGWPGGDRNIDLGVSQIQTQTQSVVTVPALTYMQSVEQSESGYLFVDGAGRVVLQNRWRILMPPTNQSTATFGDAGIGSGEIGYLPVPVPSLDDVDLQNEVTAQRVGGQQVQRAVDPISQQRYGVAPTLQFTNLLVTTDTECSAKAQWELSHHAYPIQRIRQITMMPTGDPDNAWSAILGRELHERITVIRRVPAGGSASPPFQQDSYIERVAHQITAKPAHWQTTFALSPGETIIYWLAADAVAGVAGVTTRGAY